MRSGCEAPCRDPRASPRRPTRSPPVSALCLRCAPCSPLSSPVPVAPGPPLLPLAHPRSPAVSASRAGCAPPGVCAPYCAVREGGVPPPLSPLIIRCPEARPARSRCVLPIACMGRASLMRAFAGVAALGGSLGRCLLAQAAFHLLS